MSADDVRDVLNLSGGDISDVKVLKFIKRAEVTLELELSSSIDYASCTDAEKEAITILAAIYAVCFMTGGSSVGLNFTVGDQTVGASSNLPSLDVLQAELERFLSALRGVDFRVASA